MTKIPNNKPVYDLEERTFQFTKIEKDFWSLKFEICLKFDAWNLGFERFHERLRDFSTQNIEPRTAQP